MVYGFCIHIACVYAHANIHATYMGMMSCHTHIYSLDMRIYVTRVQRMFDLASLR